MGVYSNKILFLNLDIQELFKLAYVFGIYCVCSRITIVEFITTHDIEFKIYYNYRYNLIIALIQL